MSTERQDSQNVEESEAIDMLRDLERQTPEEIRRQRSSDRIEIRESVAIRSGDSSRLTEPAVEAFTGDISMQGCRVLSPLPLGVGDVFRLEFDGQTVQLPLMFARCLRCRLIREDAFEVGFEFFTAISLSDVLGEGAAAVGASAESGGESLI